MSSLVLSGSLLQVGLCEPGGGDRTCTRHPGVILKPFPRGLLNRGSEHGHAFDDRVQRQDVLCSSR